MINTTSVAVGGYLSKVAYLSDHLAPKLRKRHQCGD